MSRQSERYSNSAMKGVARNIWRKSPTWLRVVILVLVLAVVVYSRTQEWQQEQTTDVQAAVTEGELQIHYVDVGQADCTILVSDGEALLIDAGNNNDEELVVEYLEELGVERLVYAIGTHSHEDHIGGLDSVIEHCAPEYVMLPEEDTATKTYQDVWDAIEETDVEVLRPEVGDTYQFGEASFRILGPSGKEKPDPNGYSICLMVTFGENRFLFTGDAEAEEEEEMLALGVSLECDIFQAGHHGSSTSNTKAFLQAADPVYTVISCGVDNDYGHPHAEVMAELEEQDIQIYRTDEMGTIIAVSDGKNISMHTQKK